MKHVGKMKNNSAPVIIAFRTLPGDPHSCLVVGTQGLGPSHHDALISLVETPEAQGADELASILSVRKFPDGNAMLGWFHINGKLKKVPTVDVIVTATPQDTVPLNELNKLIAEQRGITLEQLANGKDSTVETSEIASITETPALAVTEDLLDDSKLAGNLRKQAESLIKEAEALRKQADNLDPPKTTKVVKKTASKKVAA